MATVVPDTLPQEFVQEIRDLVSDTAPRVFALVHHTPATEDPADLDAYVAAWGIEYQDGGVVVMGEEGRRLMRLRSVDRAVWWLTRLTGGPIRLERPGAERTPAPPDH